jgi:hypothetical protein
MKISPPLAVALAVIAVAIAGVVTWKSFIAPYSAPPPIATGMSPGSAAKPADTTVRDAGASQAPAPAEAPKSEAPAPAPQAAPPVPMGGSGAPGATLAPPTAPSGH